MENLNFEEIKSTPEIQHDFNAIEQSCLVDLSIEMERPEILLSIGTHEYKGKFYPTPVATAGEFSAIVATSKSKKTFLKSAFAASYIGGDANILFPNIKSHRDKDYTILDFDTEQGMYYCQRTFRRVLEMVGDNYDNYKGYVTRHLTTQERIFLIDNCLKKQKELYKEDVKLVFIDGIADLVDNTNDIVMSTEASEYLLRWTFEYNIHICIVIHKSPLTNKPLGHLGTYVLKKAESVVDLEKEETCIKVTNPYSRGYSFEEFRFDVNKDALPYLIDENFI